MNITRNTLNMNNSRVSSFGVRKKKGQRANFNFTLVCIGITVSMLILFHSFLFRAIFGSKEKNDTTVILSDKNSIRKSVTNSTTRQRQLTPLTPRDYSYYTIRINTYRRNEQLLISLNHFSTCKGVAEIQVIWCDAENEPPVEVENHKSGKVLVERHDKNSLNERFRVLADLKTVGVLSIDDDVLRPCEAVDAGFFRWTRAPERMVGFDYRLHVEEKDGWKYGYKSNTENSNTYSISLTRFCFLHRDYLNYYFSLPKQILNTVALKFECEDIAMSYLISSLTGGEPPLLADYWAVNSLVKIYSEHGISSTENHKSDRDLCVDNFANLLGLKHGEHMLKGATLFLRSPFNLGAQPNGVKAIGEGYMVQRHFELNEMLKSLNKDNFFDEINKLKNNTMQEALKNGLIQKSKEWNKRWK